jgi:hypothetical protein
MAPSTPTHSIPLANPATLSLIDPEQFLQVMPNLLAVFTQVHVQALTSPDSLDPAHVARLSPAHGSELNYT